MVSVRALAATESTGLPLELPVPQRIANGNVSPIRQSMQLTEPFGAYRSINDTMRQTAPLTIIGPHGMKVILTPLAGVAFGAVLALAK